jgi:hypothetical protein
LTDLVRLTKIIRKTGRDYYTAGQRNGIDYWMRAAETGKTIATNNLKRR